MDKKEQLENIIKDLDNDSISKVLFSVLNELDEIGDETIDIIISSIGKIGNDITDKRQFEKMENVKTYMSNLRTVEIQERKRELSSLFAYEGNL